MLATVLLAIVGVILILGLVLWLFGERWKLMRSSTWRSMRESGLGLGSLHAYIYGRWTNQYIRVLIHRVFPRLHESGKTWLSARYHGKVLTNEQARSIIALNREIPLRDLEQIVPYPMARNLVLKGPPDVAAYECGCRHARQRHCEPTRVCMVIGQPFVDFILEHNPQSSHRLNQGEALELLQAEHERGHLHSAWFKDAMQNRFYAICNCCKCCCGGIEAMTERGIPMMASSGYVAEVDQTLCDFCGACEDACPFGALRMTDSAVRRDWDLCLGCGVCVDKCPTRAISLQRDERKGVPLDVRLLA